MGIRIEAEVSYPADDEVERVLGMAETVGEPVTVTFAWEGGRPLLHGVLVPAATPTRWGSGGRSLNWPTPEEFLARQAERGEQ
ncbi:hypothetical protein [Streptomyces ambofaciens]